MVVAVEPRAFDSCDDTGLSVAKAVRASGAPEGAVVMWEVASACDAPPGGGAAILGMLALVSGVRSSGGEDAGVVAFVGAAITAQGNRMEIGTKERV